MNENIEKKDNASRFIKDVKSEVGKIVWPTRNQVINNTLIVLAVILLVGIVIWGFDLLFQWLRSFLIGMA